MASGKFAEHTASQHSTTKTQALHWLLGKQRKVKPATLKEVWHQVKGTVPSATLVGFWQMASDKLAEHSAKVQALHWLLQGEAVRFNFIAIIHLMNCLTCDSWIPCFATLDSRAEEISNRLGLHQQHAVDALKTLLTRLCPFLTLPSTGTGFSLEIGIQMVRGHDHKNSNLAGYSEVWWHILSTHEQSSHSGFFFPVLY